MPADQVRICRIEAAQTLALRLEILRPGQGIEDCVFPGDDDLKTGHFGAFQKDSIIAIVSIYARQSPDLQGGSGYQIRAMATKETVRGLGLGRLLLEAAEEFAIQSGADYLWANARTTALKFYDKAGYQQQSEIFDIKGVGPHIIISKQISNGLEALLR